MIRIATMNVRAAQHDDGWKHRWSKRCRAHAGLLHSNRIHLASLQELNAHETRTLTHELNKKEERWSVHSEPQGNGIAFLQSQVSPLSEMVTVVYEHQSVTPAAYSKMMFFDINQQKTFWFYNTHLQAGESSIRAEQIKQLITDVNQTVGDDPVIVAGDFNSVTKIPALFDENNFRSMWQSALRTNDSLNTYQGWLDDREPSHGYEMVDSMYVKNNVTCVEAAVTSSTWRGIQASDHNMVWADVVIDDSDQTL